MTTIFNRSLSSGDFPSAWRDAYISPIPKASPVTCDNDLWPVALTACLSKVFEDFVVQHGSLKGVSTTFCLLDMLHNWLSALESPGTYLRVCFSDFSKSFDHIDHNILVCKLLKMGARPIIVEWICSFLSQRRQAVKLDGLLSEWAPAHAGVPQGTMLGPVLFLVMVNDLACRSSYWKYFDDITISEVVPLRSPSTIQDDLDSITAWAEENCMNLNPKCKEMRLSLLAKDLNVLQLTVNDMYLEKVSVHKVLGITLCDKLKWGQNTKEIVDKACKRLYLLSVLKRAGVPPDHLITIYCALVRSVLEYACQVWSSSVQSHLKQQLERVQKHALRIIFTGSDYETALCRGSIPSLSERRLGLRPLRKHASPLRAYIFECSPPPPRRNAVHGRNLRSNHRISLPRYRTERFKTSFFPSMAFLQ